MWPGRRCCTLANRNGFIATNGVMLLLLGITATTFAASPTISWTDNSNNETGFRVYRRATASLPEAKVCEVATNVVTCSSSEQGQAGYCYQATAFNNLGESPRSAAVCWFVPNAPSGLILTVP